MKYYMTPYRRMANLRRAFDRMHDDVWAAPSNRVSGVHVPLNVEVEDDAYVITALLPGLSSEDVDIQVLDDSISIQGEFKYEVDNEEVSYLRREIPAGSFRRVIRFPLALDAEQAEALIENGVLKLRVPQAESVRPKTIEVKAK